MTGTAQEFDNAIIQQELVALNRHQVYIHELLTSMDTSLRSLVHMFVKEYEQPDQVETVTLVGGVEYTLNKHGRRYVVVYTGTALTNATINIQGVTGTITIPANQWTYLNEPDRAIITPPGTSSYPIALKYTNYPPLMSTV